MYVRTFIVYYIIVIIIIIIIFYSAIHKKYNNVNISKRTLRECKLLDIIRIFMEQKRINVLKMQYFNRCLLIPIQYRDFLAPFLCFHNK